MALKRQQDMVAAFSMASMTDVIFLLLVFFLVTSTFVFPTALDITLPESAEQTPAKPSTRVFLDSGSNLYISYGESELMPVENRTQLVQYLEIIREQDPEGGIALYADVAVPYGDVVEVLNLGAENSMKIVLATRPMAAPSPSTPAPVQ